MQEILVKDRINNEILFKVMIPDCIIDNDAQCKRQIVEHARANDLSVANVDLTGADLTNTELQGMDFHGAILIKADLTRANISGADFSGAIFSHALCSDLVAEGTNFTGALLRNANLLDSNLWGADFTSARAIRTNFRSAYAPNAIFRHTNLSNANFESSNISNAIFDHPCIEGTIGNGTHIKTLLVHTYSVTYTKEWMQIGCQLHKIEDWWKFNTSQIHAMDFQTAVEWWAVMKPVLQALIAASPAIA